jgi:hypothetical protein
MAGGTPANPATLVGVLLRFRFFDEHYRDAFDDRVEDFARWAPKLVRFFELDLGVAFRAR